LDILLSSKRPVQPSGKRAAELADKAGYWEE
jgi:hypothetical protein